MSSQVINNFFRVVTSFSTGLSQHSDQSSFSCQGCFKVYMLAITIFYLWSSESSKDLHHAIIREGSFICVFTVFVLFVNRSQAWNEQDSRNWEFLTNSTHSYVGGKRRNVIISHRSSVLSEKSYCNHLGSS